MDSLPFGVVVVVVVVELVEWREGIVCLLIMCVSKYSTSFIE